MPDIYVRYCSLGDVTCVRDLYAADVSCMLSSGGIYTMQDTQTDPCMHIGCSDKSSVSHHLYTTGLAYTLYSSAASQQCRCHS